MIHSGSLVIFKNLIARVASAAEGRITIELESGETKKVREKDVSLLHPGPANRIPPDMEGGDFETAHAMIAAGKEGREPIPLSWSELSDLVFGEYSPASAASCARFAARGELFSIGDEGPLSLSFEEIDHLRRKNEDKMLERNRRASFVAELKTAIKRKGDAGLRSAQESARYIAELESFAAGSGERCLLAAEAGIAETREAVHQALIDSGLWENSFNPWPARDGAVLWPPKLEFPEIELSSLVAERLDLRRLESFAIDNVWSNDPDDAIAFDGDHIWVHVADPAAFVAPDSPVDSEALSRGATLYLPEKIVPMLPPGAVDLLGLGLAETSRALSFGMRLSPDGTLEETTVAPSIVKVKRLSYEEADAMLGAGHPALKSLDAAASLRHSRRLSNGAVDIDMPEVSMKVEKNEVRFLSVPPTRSSGLVREMMLLAGEAVARWANERKIPFVYSSQEAPQLPSSLQRYDEGERFLSQQYQRRKGMKASIVGTEALAHRGLGLSFYSQVTSPLRRYQDLLAHYQIRAWLSSNARGSPPKGSPSPAVLSADEISRRCIISGQGASSARQAERDSRLHWTAFYLSTHPGWKGEARVLEARDRDAWILVPELGLETSLRTRNSLAPDETIEVEAARASVALHDITFFAVSG
jgi:exoribonuclease-2